ncbi:DNA-directed RNA polymerase I subunit RPA2-like isoform X2 [Mytilus edulis]
MLEEGLGKAVQLIYPVEFALPNGDRISFTVLDANVYKPVVSQSNKTSVNLKVYPAECRQRFVTYKGNFQITFVWKINNKPQDTVERTIGEIPIMVKSKRCNLQGLSPKELVKHGEEAEEMGGYFIVNGLEKVIRMLIMPRRNYAMCMIRPSWRSRGKQYTEYGVQIKCVRQDQTGMNNVLHYLSNGSATIGFGYLKELFYVPVMFILKGLMNVTDKYIYDQLVNGKEDDSFYKGCIVFMLRQALTEDLTTQTKVLQYIGSKFRIKLPLPEWYSDEEVGQFLIRECICIHLENNTDKFNLLIFMIRKLFAFSKGECAAESADSPANQELLLGGHLYLAVLKEKIEAWLISLKATILRNAKTKEGTYKLTSKTLEDAFRHTADVGKSVEYLLSTGNLISRSGLGLMQTSGLAVVADKLNFYRYLSHFRSVHRGAFFAEMRTTAVRKFLPEAWGFLCPVHTPDGAPCGLLNHMTAFCQAVNIQYPTAHLYKLLISLGVTPFDAPPPGNLKDCFPVLLDGRHMGYLHSSIAKKVEQKLRVMKVKGLKQVPTMMEICLIPKTEFASQYPGLYLFTTPARMMRPVKNLALDTTEMIGSFEQVYMDICINQNEAIPGVTTHEEFSEIRMLSSLACLTPYSDCNQSPRNMYQCQMGKQTMGTPCHAYKYRADNKLYRIQTPQSPMVRPGMHDHYDVDNYPMGTNAVVAVISYTGYDMEDAMILNKSAFDRGFAHGSIYKSELIDLRKKAQDKYRTVLVFGSKAGDKRTEGKLDPDGLPPIGTYLQDGDVYYSFYNLQTGEYRVERYRKSEPSYVDHIKIIGNDTGTGDMEKVCIVLRIVRNPIVGDKFSSRHGQKGICSMLYPVENLPFTESGMVPDIIFNPHGYPSRMTIGMMIESMAGKSAASHGHCYDATPFKYTEDQPPIDYMGKMLNAAGYNYYGTERLYSGVDGRELEADIFIGIVYYQRLRHMVSDKFQVRTTGPIDQVTHQPVKGRKRGGGIRFGEMERDALISHGSAFLLQDRLLNCSDSSLAHVCKKCGSILSPYMDRPPSANAAVSAEQERKWSCSICKQTNSIELIKVPYVFKYLVAELAAINIKVNLDIQAF